MKVAEIKKFVSRKAHRAGLKVRKYSPEILLVTGVGGVVVSTVMACRATTKIDPILEKAQDDLAVIDEAFERGAVKAKQDDEIVYVPYTEEDYKKDRLITKVKTGFELGKVYAPAAAVGVTAIGCILASHNIIRKRNIALAAAYKAVDSSFKDYRGRLIDRFGKELDRELRYNIKAEEVEEIIVDEEGKETTVNKTIHVMDPNNYSPYSIVFDDGNTGWDPNPELTKFFLIQQQNYANELLEARGHLFLNEVYDMLGAKRTSAGAQVGWVKDYGDGFVDFGIFDIYSPKARDFVNGREKVIVLDFNVDGVILDMI